MMPHPGAATATTKVRGPRTHARLLLVHGYRFEPVIVINFTDWELGWYILLFMFIIVPCGLGCMASWAGEDPC